MSVDDQLIRGLAASAAAIAHPVFIARGWTWHSEPLPPSESEIREHIENEIRQLLSDPATSCVRCGRFRINRDRDDEIGAEEIIVSLELGRL